MADGLFPNRTRISTTKTSDFERIFCEEAPVPNPSRSLITGVVCGVRVADIEDNLMKEIRYLDKMIDELAKGKKNGKDPQKLIFPEIFFSFAHL